MSKLTKAEMTTTLKSNVVEVNFTKVDGSERIMIGTLMSEYLPESDSSSSKKPNDDVVVIWELNNGFRSFRVDSVNSFEIV